MITVDSLSVTFNHGTPTEVRALDRISLQVQRGEFLTVIGPNGSGKSTFLNVLAGEVMPNGGSLRLSGREANADPIHVRARSVARVFQDPLAGTCGSLTVEENLALALARTRPRRLGRAITKADRTLFEQRLVPLGLAHRLSDKVGLLSGGQRQTLSLVMATLEPSLVLLLDEHTAALDPKAARNVLDLTQSVVTAAGLTVVMVTHSMRDAIQYGDRLLLLRQGRIRLDLSGAAKRSLTSADLLHHFEPDDSEAESSSLLQPAHTEQCP